jgi:hypothetical protein
VGEHVTLLLIATGIPPRRYCGSIYGIVIFEGSLGFVEEFPYLL